MEMSRWMCNKVSPLSLLFVILDQNVVFILFKLLNNLSAEHVVMGRVHRILTRATMLGYMLLMCLGVRMRLLGKLFSS